jgi:hypothetical protein
MNEDRHSNDIICYGKFICLSETTSSLSNPQIDELVDTLLHNIVEPDDKINQEFDYALKKR